MQLEQQMHQAAVAGSQEAVSVHTTESKSVDGNINSFIFQFNFLYKLLFVRFNLLLAWNLVFAVHVPIFGDGCSVNAFRYVKEAKTCHSCTD